MCVVENIEHVDVTAKYSQGIRHPTIVNTARMIQKIGMSSVEKVLEVEMKKLEAAKK